MRRALTQLGWLVLMAPPLLSQGSDAIHESWRWARFTTESGLPSNRVHQVVDATDGAVWAGTEKGLAWYDGYRWRPVGVAAGVPEKRPTFLAAAPKGEILAIFEGAFYRGGKNGFELTPLEYQGAPLRPTSVASLPDQRLVVDTERGVFYLSADGKLTPDPGLPRPGGGSGPKVFATRSPGLWFYGRQELYRWTGSGPRRWFSARDLGIHSGELGELRIRVLEENPDGSGLVSVGFPIASRGLWEWSSGGRPVKSASEGKEVVRALDLAPSGEAVAAYESGDIRIRRNGKWSALEPAPEPMRNVICLRYRPNQDLWVGTENGLYLHKRSSKRWIRCQFPFPDLRNNVDEILEARDGSLWLATGDGVTVRRPDGRTESFRTAGGQLLGITTGLGEDQEGHIWVSSSSTFKGAWRWDGARWQHFGAEEGLLDARIGKIRRDSQGRLWFLSAAETQEPDSESGAAFYSAGRFEVWKRQPGVLPAGVNGLADAPDGTLWFATNAGLSRWRRGQWRHWDFSRGLKAAPTLAVAVAPDRRVWFGGRGTGVGYLDDQDQPHYLTQADGLPSVHIWDLRFDRHGTLWATTDAGLACYRDGNWSRFQTAVGLANPRIWPVLPSLDRVYVGTIGSGLYILDRTDGANAGPKVEIARPFVEDTNLLVRWTAFGYWGEQPSEAIETRYRLDQNGWSEWSTRRELSLRDLAAGDYRFQVQAKGLFGHIDPAGAVAAFRVSPPLYRRSAFLVPITLSLLAAAMLAGILIWRKIQFRRDLEESERRYRAVVEDQSEFICRSLPDGTLTFVNEAYCRHLGRRREELIGRSLVEVLSAEEARGLRQRLAALTPDNAAGSFEDRVTLPDGSVLCQRWNIRGFFDAEGRCLEYQSVGRDVTAQMKAEEELRASEERFRQLATHLRQVFFITDPALTQMVYISPAYQDVFGSSCESIYAHPRAWLDCVHPDDRSQVAASIGQPAVGTPRPLEYRIVRPSGETRWIRSQSFPLRDEAGNTYRIVGLAEDITEWRHLEAQLVQAQKMEAVGQLAGGVAHDFNNLLTVIQGHADLMLHRLDAASRSRNHADQILIATQRASALTQQLLAFSRRQIMQPTVVNLNEVVADVEDMLGRLIGENIELVTRLEPRLGSVRADRGQLGQVLMNLAVNARDAMPDGGRLTIETSNVWLEHAPAGREEEVVRGDYVRVSVRDNGSGIDETTASRVFEPFFTTKAKGKGTGLGLSTAYGIVKQSGGYIWLESELGQGACFEIFLPQVTEETGVFQTLQPSSAPGGRETVLVVEDEEGVRRLVTQLLEDHGYHVLAAANGPEALRVFEQPGQLIDMMLSDVVMPHMSGRELAQRVTQLRPGLKVLYMSGYTDDAIDRHGVLEPGTAFIQKPFSLIALAQKVREVLDTRTATATGR
ncbi:MAG: PAS domain S-box protein [Acidobacteria bacterium]|nr:PAS domain S-box protein [Acidobacteriota bacterium]